MLIGSSNHPYMQELKMPLKTKITLKVKDLSRSLI
tara:strand:+ start:440 stop:544 length:105 start_codon:yes stop_codon:yes gene_type:complete